MTAQRLPAYDHVVVVVEENHSYSEIIGNPQAAYINLLASGGVLLTDYHAITRPSQPNYFALYAGRTFGADNGVYSLSGPTLGTILTAAGNNFAGYVEAGSPRKHNPWESFPEGTAVGRDMAAFPSADYSLLPDVAFVVPDLNDDMHDGTIALADQWLKAHLDGYAHWATTHNSLLIVVWDEANLADSTNHVPAIFYGANLNPGTYAGNYDHYDLLHTLLDLYELDAPNHAFAAQGIGRELFVNVLTGGTEDDVLDGIEGSDTLTGAEGDDTLHGLGGNDHLIGGPGADVLDGGPGVDFGDYSRAEGPVLANLLAPGDNTGEAAGDRYYSVEGLIGSAFGDALRIGNGGGSIWALAGDDTLFGGAGNDDLHGGDGNDHLRGKAGADVLDGGDGMDFANYSTAAGPVLANLLTPGDNIGEAAGDSYSSVEGLIGSAFGDALRIGNGGGSIWALGGDDTLFGGIGNDDLHGQDGNDHLLAGAGVDILDGGAGIDFADYSTAAGPVLANLLTPGDNIGEATSDTYDSIEGLIGSAFGDALRIGNGGGSIWALGGDDTIFGGVGDDDLHGQEGNDTLRGGGGADVLEGGAGSDSFVFTRGKDGGETVLDFDGGGAGAGDNLMFGGYGTSAQGATFTQVDATHWSIDSADGCVHHVVTFGNAPSIHASDYMFL